MDRPGCFCCKARTCLVAWSIFSLLAALVGIFPITTPGTAPNHFMAVSMTSIIISLLVNGFILYSAIKKETKFLKVSFWLVIVYMLYAITVSIVTGLLYKTPDGKDVPIAATVITPIVLIGVIDGLLAWTIRRAVNEVEDEGYNGMYA